MSLPDTIFIFGLALVIFGPKKLPEIGRQIGKLVFEFRRASNEFKLQIEEELRAAEIADRKKQAEAAASPPAQPRPETTPEPANPADPNPPEPAESHAADSPAELTIRPPSTGTLVSAGSTIPVVGYGEYSSTAVEVAGPDPSSTVEEVTAHLGQRGEQHEMSEEPVPNHHV